MRKRKQPVSTCLDRLPAGSADFLREETRKRDAESRRLPAGCHPVELYRDIARMAWPSLIELLLTSLVSMVDMMMVGTMANGDRAISAVSLASQPKFIFVSLLIALNVGVTASVARARGAQEPRQANAALCHGLLLSFLVSLVSSLLGYGFAPALIRFMATGSLDGVTVAMSTEYLRIQMQGFLLMGMTTTFTAALRGVGNTAVPMVYNATANLVNICGNYLLINGHLGFPALGVRGASLATVIGQGVAFAIACMVTTGGKSYFTISLRTWFRDFKSTLPTLRNIIAVGVPSLGEQFVTRVGMILFARQIASLGQPFYTTHQILSNIQMLSFMLGQAMAVSSTTLVGQSLGKKRPDMAVHYSRHCTYLGIVLALLLSGLLVAWGENLTALYSRTPAVLAAAEPVLLILVLMLPIQTPQFILTGSLRGAGDTASAALVTFVGILVLRPLLVQLAISVFHSGLAGAWIATLAELIARMTLVLIIYSKGRWKTLRLQ